MNKPNLPEGYLIEKKAIKEREFTLLYNSEGKIVLALPTEHCPEERITEVIQQIENMKN